MARYVALLRAINVSGRNVKMADLRRLFEELDFANVETFIASGNVIFESPEKDTQALENTIERHLEKSLGYAVATLLRTPEELAKIAAYEPFGEVDPGSSLYIVFLAEEPSTEAKKRLEALSNPMDEFHAHGREVYWLARRSLGESKVSGAMIEKAASMPGTNRNATTVRKLAAKYQAS